nr:substrate-binding domain-containing protein [uncultured Cupriavidus sp.]
MKFQFELSPSVYIGESRQDASRIFGLLQGIRETGSLQQAARQAGLSYRYAWESIREWERISDQKLVDMRRGKGTMLTRLGENLLRAERRLREAVEPLIETAASEFHQHIDSVAAPTRELVRFSGTRDAATDALTDALGGASSSLALDTVICGAIDGLICLHERHAELAGFHISPVHKAGTRLQHLFKPWLKSADVRLLRVSWREQGLMVSPSAAGAIRGLSDLVTHRVRFLNRQRSSATRALFDQVLVDQGILPYQIPGYESCAHSNDEVAESIRDGKADVGFGLRATAEAAGLTFVAITREAYYLALRKPDCDAAWAIELLDLLRTEALIERIRKTPGYWPESAQRLMPLQEALPW